MIARGEAGGADARAYWAGVRIWLNGGDPYHPTGPFLPYVYAPWMLPGFAPWAVLPWDVAWFVWRVGTILLLLWTIHWAYRRRPLTTAVIVALLAFPFGANLDTGNINLQLTLMLWAANFTGPRLGGLLWALATWMKWVPALNWFILPGKAKQWGLGLARRLDRPEHRDAAPDDHPDAGAVRVRCAADPPRLPGLRLVLGAVAVPPARSVRLPAVGDVAALVRGGPRDAPSPDHTAGCELTGAVATTASGGWPVLAPALVHRPQQNAPIPISQRPAREPPEGRIRPARPADDVHHACRPTASARTPADAVATFERPMYRPDDAFGMMSVMSAQSTARNIPAEIPYSRAPPNAIGEHRRAGDHRETRSHSPRSWPR